MAGVVCAEDHVIAALLTHCGIDVRSPAWQNMTARKSDKWPQRGMRHDNRDNDGGITVGTLTASEARWAEGRQRSQLS